MLTCFGCAITCGLGTAYEFYNFLDICSFRAQQDVNHFGDIAHYSKASAQSFPHFHV